MRRVLLTAVTILALAGRGGAACVGDCSGNGEVTVDELIKGVNIALGNGSVAQCPSFDLSNDGTVAINELIAAVNGALVGCDGTATTPTPTATPITASPTSTASGPTPTSVAGCGDGTLRVTITDASADSNVTRDAIDLPKGLAVDSGTAPGTYVWAISGMPCSQGFGEVVRSVSINVSDAAGRIVPGTYAISLQSLPFIRVDYRETKFILGNPGQSFAHQWLSTGGTLEVSDAGGGALHFHANGVTMDIGPTFPGAVGTFSMDIDGTLGKITHN